MCMDIWLNLIPNFILSKQTDQTLKIEFKKEEGAFICVINVMFIWFHHQSQLFCCLNNSDKQSKKNSHAFWSSQTYL